MRNFTRCVFTIFCKRLWQVHLGTALIATVIIGFQFYLSFRVYPTEFEKSRVAPLFDYYEEAGWPIACFYRRTLFSTKVGTIYNAHGYDSRSYRLDLFQKYHADAKEETVTTEFSKLNLAIDIACSALFVFIFSCVIEWLIRRREGRRI